jgi:sialidase-1
MLAAPTANGENAIADRPSVGIAAMKTLAWTLVTAALLGLAPKALGQSPASGKTSSTGIWLDGRVDDVPALPMGPFTRVGERSTLTVDTAQSALISSDEGQTWKSRPIFADSAKYAIRPERAILRTRSGAVILAFMNDKEKANWHWDPKISDSPNAQLPTYAVRSPDGGQTWEEPQKLHDDWTGAVRDMIQTTKGSVVFTSMMMLHHPGRHAVVTYTSADDGRSWRRSNVIDLGGVGHHGGVTEATIEELKDGRLWLLLRTNWKFFWEAFSDDDGISWRDMRATTIDASSAPGLLKRLASGRLILVWNRYFPEGQTSFPLSGGDNQWSEVPVSNHREELSIKFSEDDGRTWTTPAMIARKKGTWLAYPYLVEIRPGDIWITTMQGGLRVRLREQDFVGR